MKSRTRLDSDVDQQDAVDLPPGMAELSRLLDDLPGMVAYWDHEGRNRYANTAYADWFGVRPGELHGRHISEVLGEEQYDRYRGFVDGALAGETQQFEGVTVDPRGRTRHLHTSYVPHLVDGVPSGYFVMAADTTTRDRTDEALHESARQLALLEERQRIAADLHDFVVQRLFAAGLDLAAAQKSGSWERVASAAVGVDDAIRELRKSIYSLRELMSPAQVPASVAQVLDNAGRMLGFAPSITYTGALENVSPEVVQDMLAVLTEALSNVARHAGASQVDVTVAGADGQLLLRVADNGRGIGSTERSSGLSNMRRRAERLGGDFVCRDNQPSGTVVDWMVPVAP